MPLGYSYFELYYDYFFYVAAVIVGLIPFLYLKKSLKKDILKVNVLSSVVAFVVLAIAYVLLGQLGGHFASGAANSGVGSILSIIDISGALLQGVIFLVLFNVPFLLYFIFGKKDDVEESV
jgi:hypothetical protein